MNREQIIEHYKGFFGIDRVTTKADLVIIDWAESLLQEQNNENSIKSHWNYRVLATEHNGEVFLNIHEVYYKNDIPEMYSTNPVPVGSETVKGITWSLNKMKEATKKPILWGDERFPNVCDKIERS